MRRLLMLTTATLLLGAACSSTPETQEELCPNPTTTTSVVLADFSFKPTCVAVDEGATLSIDNEGQAPHSFSIDGADLDLDAGESGTLDLTGIAPDTYEVICTYHPQMKAALQVT